MKNAPRKEQKKTRRPAKGKDSAGARSRFSPSAKNRVSERAGASADRSGSQTYRSSLTVVSETDHYVVLDKPALLDSQNSKPGRPSVVEWLQKKFGFAGLVHRLDFGTSGLLVCAKTAESANLLTRKLQEGAIDRSYLAVVLGKILPDSGALESEVDEKPARLEFKVRERFRNATLVEVTLETGRKHQIRKQFSDFNHPLLGDHLYGKKGAKLLFERPALHAFRLKIDSKVYEVKMPADLEALIARLR